MALSGVVHCRTWRTGAAREGQRNAGGRLQVGILGDASACCGGAHHGGGRVPREQLALATLEDNSRKGSRCCAAAISSWARGGGWACRRCSACAGCGSCGCDTRFLGRVKLPMLLHLLIQTPQTCRQAAGKCRAAALNCQSAHCSQGRHQSDLMLQTVLYRSEQPICMSFSRCQACCVCCLPRRLCILLWRTACHSTSAQRRRSSC